jgi:hypothetical protein
VDDELLAEAKRARARLIDAERDVEVARAEFHRAVRRLHLHGASLRELALGLGLSHQRVHQIVESAGGSRRWLRRRETGTPNADFHAANRASCGGAVAAGLPGLMTSWPWELAGPPLGREDRR